MTEGRVEAQGPVGSWSTSVRVVAVQSRLVAPGMARAGGSETCLDMHRSGFLPRRVAASLPISGSTPTLNLEQVLNERNSLADVRSNQVPLPSSSSHGVYAAGFGDRPEISVPHTEARAPHSTQEDIGGRNKKKKPDFSDNKTNTSQSYFGEG